MDVVYGDWGAERRAAERRLRDEAPTTSDVREHIIVALTSALLGDVEWSRIAAARAETTTCGDPCSTMALATARSICWMAAGDPSTAAQVLLDASGGLGDTDPTGREAAFALGVIAETAVRSGRGLEARRLLDDPPRVTRSDPLAAHELDLARAFLADDAAEAMGRWLDTGLPIPSFALGRAHLWIGMTLRRRREKLRALHHLRLAVDHLEENHRGPWLAAASIELRAAGASVDPSGADLTEQQKTIARLAALGLSNREIGDRLFLSPRTVGSHLYRIFPKLGVTSRRQLAGVVRTSGDRVS